MLTSRFDSHFERSNINFNESNWMAWPSVLRVLSTAFENQHDKYAKISMVFC